MRIYSWIISREMNPENEEDYETTFNVILREKINWWQRRMKNNVLTKRIMRVYQWWNVKQTIPVVCEEFSWVESRRREYNNV